MPLPDKRIEDAEFRRNFEKIASMLHEGNGSPEGVVKARIGAIYQRRDGGAGTSLYVKQSDPSGPTGWAAITP